MTITKWAAFKAGLPVVITSSPVTCRAPASRPCRPACSKLEPNGGYWPSLGTFRVPTRRP